MFILLAVKVTQRPTGEQRTPHPAAEEEAVRAGGGEEEQISSGCGARRCSCGGQEAPEEGGASADGAEGCEILQH